MRLVIFVFCGRRANMEVQMPYLHRILDLYPEAELHLWDLTRDPMDHLYVEGLEGAHDGRVRVLGHLYDQAAPCLYPDGWPGRRLPRGWRRCTCLVHKPPYEEPYRYYAGTHIVDYQDTADTIYVKIDDDVLFLETERFDDLIDPVIAHPERVVSASVVNNAVCAKYREDWMQTANQFVTGDRSPKNDHRWWALHEMPQFANWCHERFLGSVASTLDFNEGYVRTRPGEAVSINCIAFGHQTMVKLVGMMSDRLGDEGAVDRLLPWIALSFTVAHLSFGPQDKQIDPEYLRSLRERYTQLSKEYLG